MRPFSSRNPVLAGCVVQDCEAVLPQVDDPKTQIEEGFLTGHSVEVVTLHLLDGAADA